ncbi:MAG: hypothetical protein M3478_14620 [Planctomycetota bacterium]|nr:hypothetical protein [Planctomycetota bacterium]
MIACASLCFITIFAYAGPGWAEVTFRLLTDGILLVVWLAAAYGIGSVVPLPATASPMRGVTRIAIGLGAMSLLTLGLGLAGAMNRMTAFALLGIGIAITIAHAIRARETLSPAVRTWRHARAGCAWLWAAAMPFLAMAVVAALVPPGVLWGDEPNGYDVVEYHLQIPREWYEAGRITGLHHNVFSYFPFNVEMQFLLAMHVRGGPWAGMYLAQFMHVGYVALAVAGVYAAARSTGGNGTIAGVCAAATPWLALLAPVGYNEGGLLLYGTLAIGWTLHALRDPERRVATMALAGAMAGFACGVKLTAVPMLLLPLPAALVIIAVARREPVGRAIIASIAFAVVGLALFSPWLVRNVVWTGNPVFPEAQTVFGRGHFTEAQSERWKAAHSPRADQQGAGARLKAAWEQIAKDARFGFVLLPLALVCAALAHRRPETWLLLAMLAVLLAIWLGFTHLQSRFFVLAVPVAALLFAQVRDRANMATGIFAVVLAFVGLGVLHGRMTEWLDEKQVTRLLGYEALSQFMVPEIAAKLPNDIPLALVGDAKAFCYQRPMSRLRYRTVFDVGPGEDAVAAWLGGRINQKAVLFVDPNEIRRFQKTYSGLPKLAPDLIDRTEPFVLTDRAQ